LGEEKIILTFEEKQEIIRGIGSVGLVDASVLVGRKARAIANQRGCQKNEVIKAIVEQAGLSAAIKKRLLNPKKAGPHGRSHAEDQDRKKYGQRNRRRGPKGNPRRRLP